MYFITVIARSLGWKPLLVVPQFITSCSFSHASYQCHATICYSLQWRPSKSQFKGYQNLETKHQNQQLILRCFVFTRWLLEPFHCFWYILANFHSFLACLLLFRATRANYGVAVYSLKSTLPKTNALFWKSNIRSDFTKGRGPMHLNKENRGHSGNEISGVKRTQGEGKCVDSKDGNFLEPHSDRVS